MCEAHIREEEKTGIVLECFGHGDLCPCTKRRENKK